MYKRQLFLRMVSDRVRKPAGRKWTRSALTNGGGLSSSRECRVRENRSGSTSWCCGFVCAISGRSLFSVRRIRRLSITSESLSLIHIWGCCRNSGYLCVESLPGPKLLYNKVGRNCPPGRRCLRLSDACLLYTSYI